MTPPPQSSPPFNPAASLYAGLLRPLWPYVRAYRRRLWLALLALLAAAGTVLLVGQGLRAVVDQGFVTASPTMLNQSLLALLGVVTVLALASAGRYYLVTWLSERVVADLRRDVQAHLLRLPASFFEQARPGDLLARITGDAALLQGTIGASLSVLLRNSLMMLGGLAMLLLTSTQLTLLVLVTVPVVLAPIILFGRRVRGESRAAQDRLGAAAAQLEESLHGMRVIQAFTAEDTIARHYATSSEAAFGAAVTRIRTRAWLVALVIGLAFAGIGLVLWSGGHAVLDGRMSAGQLSAFVFYAVLVAAAAAALAETGGELQRARAAADRLFEILAIAPAARGSQRPAAPARGAIQFTEVCFHYPDRLPLLRGVSFTIQPGERVALVGPSGAGKSTILQLLLGFYTPTAGQICIDGLALDNLDREWLRRQIAWVPQEATLFSTSVADNIQLGRPDASTAAIGRAAAAAQADAFIAGLPDRAATLLGQKGMTLSGGQRQRLTLARALLRDAPILLLDEATSALDAESEEAVQNALNTLMQGRTTLVVAHRLATVRQADRILVLDDGQIVASGTHSELMAQNGLYARLAALQFQTDNTPGRGIHATA